MAPPTYNTIVVDVDATIHVGTLRLNRPSKSNAIDADMWAEIPSAVKYLDENEDVRVVVLKGSGKNFCAGIDVSTPQSLAGQLGQSPAMRGGCAGRKAEALYRHIKRLQDSFTALERCRKPVFCAIQGACFGGGVDMAVACDVRYCTADARFCVKEVDLAITADIGTLQRLPKIVGHGVATELALTAREISGDEALRIGLVAGVEPHVEALERRVAEAATQLARKSPLAVQGTKATMIHARDHGVPEGLEYVAMMNSARLTSQDLEEAMGAKFQRRDPLFAKL